MTDQGALEAANRAAHKVARESVENRRLYRLTVAEDIGYGAFVESSEKLEHALDEYEEAERRAQREATGKERIDGSS